MKAYGLSSLFFFFNDTATTEIYTLSLHDALPISRWPPVDRPGEQCAKRGWRRRSSTRTGGATSSAPTECSAERSEEHTSELQSRQYLVCRLLLEKKKKINHSHSYIIP